MSRKRRRDEAFHSGGDSDRTYLSKGLVTGKIVNWDSRGFGWVTPHQDLTYLPGVNSRTSIFIRQRDFKSRHVEPRTGDDVSFILYTGDRGLGGERVAIFNGDDPNGFPTNALEWGSNKRDGINEEIGVVNMLAEDTYLDDLIGVRGETITKMQKDSGAKIQVCPGYHVAQRKDKWKGMINQNYKLVQFEGSKNAVSEAVCNVALSLCGRKWCTVTLLIQCQHAARFIGKGGDRIKSMRALAGSQKVLVFVNKKQEQVVINETNHYTISIKGPVEEISEPLKEAVAALHSFHVGMLRDKEVIYPCTTFKCQNPLSWELHI